MVLDTIHWGIFLKATKNMLLSLYLSQHERVNLGTQKCHKTNGGKIKYSHQLSHDSFSPIFPTNSWFYSNASIDRLLLSLVGQDKPRENQHGTHLLCLLYKYLIYSEPTVKRQFIDFAMLKLQHVYNSLLGRLEITLTVLTVKVKIWLHCPKNVKPHRPEVIKGFKTLYGITLKFKVSIANLNKYKIHHTTRALYLAIKNERQLFSVGCVFLVQMQSKEWHRLQNLRLTLTRENQVCNFVISQFSKRNWWEPHALF